MSPTPLLGVGVKKGGGCISHNWFLFGENYMNTKVLKIIKWYQKINFRPSKCLPPPINRVGMKMGEVSYLRIGSFLEKITRIQKCLESWMYIRKSISHPKNDSHPPIREWGIEKGGGFISRNRFIFGKIFTNKKVLKIINLYQRINF